MHLDHTHTGYQVRRCLDPSDQPGKVSDTVGFYGRAIVGMKPTTLSRVQMRAIVRKGGSGIIARAPP